MGLTMIGLTYDILKSRRDWLTLPVRSSGSQINFANPLKYFGTKGGGGWTNKLLKSKLANIIAKLNREPFYTKKKHNQRIQFDNNKL